MLLGCLLALPLLVQAQVPPRPNPLRPVQDFANLLDTATQDSLTRLIEAHQLAAGTAILVVTVPNLKGDEIKPYANQLFRSWGLGQQGRDNGVLLLVSVQDRKARIEVGYGLEGQLPDIRTDSILRHLLVPQFKEGNYGQGVLLAVQAIVAATGGPPMEPVEEELEWYWIALMLLFISLTINTIWRIGSSMYKGMRRSRRSRSRNNDDDDNSRSSSFWSSSSDDSSSSSSSDDSSSSFDSGSSGGDSGGGGSDSSW